MKKLLLTVGCLVVVGMTRGDTYTVAEGETQTLDSVTNTTRFTKSGKGTFGLAPDWPMNWLVKYTSDLKSVYVYHQNGTQIIMR
ncbi:MAG: hypothetical protein IJI36_03475 [Kiritimatiellae bacterium]|nr:hypothetical protein [Kiritimatiellia bacterium]